MATDNDLARWQHALAPAFLWDVGRRRIVWANAAAVNWFGAASLGDLVERTFGTREPAVAALAEAAQQLRQPGECREMELHFLSAGQQPPLSARICAHALPGGRPGLLVIAEDATAALASRPQMLLEVLHELPSAVAVVDATGALLYANPEALQLAGEEGLAGLRAFFPSLADARAFLLRALQAGAATLVREVNTPFGPRQLRISARPAQDEGFLILTLDDLTDRLAAERDGALGLNPRSIHAPAQATRPSLPEEQPDTSPASLQEEEAPAVAQQSSASALSAEELEILRRIAETLGRESGAGQPQTSQPSLDAEPAVEADETAKAEETPASEASAADTAKPLPDAASSAMPQQQNTASDAQQRQDAESARRRITIRRRPARATRDDSEGEPAPERRQPRISISNAATDERKAREDTPASTSEPAPEGERPTFAQSSTSASPAEDGQPLRPHDQPEEQPEEQPQRPPRPEVPGLVRQVMDQQSDPVILHRADAFYYANRAARELFGHELEDEAWDALAARLMQAADGSEIELADASGRQHRFQLKRDAFPWQSGVVVQSTLKPLQQAAAPDEKAPQTTVSTATSSDHPSPRQRAEDAARALQALTAPPSPPSESEETGREASGASPATSLAQQQPRRQQADVIRLRVSRPLPEEKAQDSVAPAPATAEACDDVKIDAELRALLDTAADGIMTLNAAGRILSFSSGAARLFGLAAHEAIGRHFTELFAERDRAAIEDYLASLKTAARPGEGREVSGLTKSGEEIPLFLTIGRLHHGRLVEHEEHASYCVVVRDLSAWKRKENELVRAKEAAERASAQKSEFLAMISHELRTPLNAILGFADVLRQQMFGKLGNEKYLDYARDIYESGEHLLSLINDLLDLSRIEAGRFELDFVEVDLSAIVEETVHTMREQIAASGVQVRTAIPRRLPKVVADVRSMKQIMFNLLSNAVKFCDKDDLVTITLARKDDGSVELLVRDTGPGMTREELANALEPFRRNEKGGADQPPGTGLGLPLTKALAEANKAQFAIDSEPGRGTEVRITFPPHRVLI